MTYSGENTQESRWSSNSSSLIVPSQPYGHEYSNFTTGIFLSTHFPSVHFLGQRSCIFNQAPAHLAHTIMLHFTQHLAGWAGSIQIRQQCYSSLYQGLFMYCPRSYFLASPFLVSMINIWWLNMSWCGYNGNIRGGGLCFRVLSFLRCWGSAWSACVCGRRGVRMWRSRRLWGCRRFAASFERLLSGRLFSCLLYSPLEGIRRSHGLWGLRKSEGRRDESPSQQESPDGGCNIDPESQLCHY